MDRLEVEGAIVPMLWRLELGNMLVQAQRRHRVRNTSLPSTLDLVTRLPSLPTHRPMTEPYEGYSPLLYKRD